MNDDTSAVGPGGRPPRARTGSAKRSDSPKRSGTFIYPLPSTPLPSSTPMTSNPGPRAEVSHASDRNPAGGPFRYGTVARNSLTGPGIVSVDASANKRFTISGGTYAELRIEVFNVGNHPIWNQPGNTLRTPTFGVITSTRMDSRQLQIGMKLVF